jgi:hypothetical protein
MREKALLLVFGLLGISSIIAAQETTERVITRDEFINSEWEMKSKYYQKLLERQEGGMLLDQDDYDVKYWDLWVDVTNISGQIISGRVAMTVQSVVDSLVSIDYDFHSSMTVDSVRINGQPATYTRPSGLVRITLDHAYGNGQLVTTVVYYHGHPPGGGFGSFTWETHGSGDPIISTLSEPEGAREWWPCKDMPHDKGDSADVHITVDTDLVATSNGALTGVTDHGNGTHTYNWHISYPITTYLICLSVSNYQSFTDWYVTDDGDSMPVTNYVYPEHYNQAVIDLSITPEAIGVYADLFGEYPFIREKYGHSIFPWGGAMEHQCNTSYGDGLIRGDHSYDWILVHELGHQWFGDMISCDTWPDIWMNEGFASYLEALWSEYLGGPTAYTSYMRNNSAVYDPSGPIYDPDPLFDGNTVYNKGAWVLHMLRGVMNDSSFFAGMYGYANHPSHQHGTIQTRQFQHIMEEYYGDSLGWFFDQWVWGQNRPIFRYSWMKQDIGNGRYEIFLHITQIQNSPAPNVFTMPIRVYPRISNVDTLITVWNDSRIDDVRFIVVGNPTTFAFDKYFWVLRDASSEQYRLNIVSTELPNGYRNIGYEDTVEARGGTLPYQFSVQTGQLPRGLSLEMSTGRIYGIPDSLGTYDFTIRCTDASSPQLSDTQQNTVTITQLVGIDEDIRQPTEFKLMGNYPNPFNGSTIIRLELPDAGFVKVDIYNILGQHIQTLFDGRMNAGQNEVVWNSKNTPSGIYLYKVSSGVRHASSKMVLIK